MITSDSRDFLDGITRDFEDFREGLREDDSESCLCIPCLKKCQELTTNVCNQSYDKFLCYTENNKCTTQASNRFCNKCNTDTEILRRDLSFFRYQLFLEDYMRQLNELPNDEINSRGLLIYHGLGSGKTCSGLLLAESCRKYGGNKKRHVILMIPASLILDPWIKEITGRCNKNNKLKKALREARRKNKDKSEEEQKKIYKKICAEHRLYIIHYNAETQGGWRDAIIELRRDLKVNNIFDNSVIIIDEVHNFTNAIVNLGEDEIRGTKKELYWDIYTAKNARVLLLTGTPIFNKPVELGYMFNMVRGRITSNLNIIFPTNEEEFNKLFVKDMGGGKLEINNPNMFRRRINGLVSYYRGANKKQFAEKVEDDIFVPFSGSQATNYEKIYRLESKKNNDNTGGEKLSRTKLNSQMISNVNLPRYVFDEKQQRNYENKRGNRLTKNGEVIPVLSIRERMPGLADRKDYDKVIKILDNDDKPLHIDNDLNEISRKMYHAYKIIRQSRGPILFYSRFEGIYGIQMFSEVLKQNGYIDYDKMKGDTEEKIAEIARRRNLDDNEPEKIKGTYMLWTGNHRLNKTREVFNKFENQDGSIIRCFLMTGAGKEGINLYGVRQVHILEPWWNEVIDNQVVGRAIRMCSHSHIPISDFEDLQYNEDERDHERRLVNVYKYYGLLDLRPTNFSNNSSIKSEKMIEDIKRAQMMMKRKSADYLMYKVSKKKKDKSELFLNLMKDVSIDCYINQIINERTSDCFKDENFENYFESWDIRDDARIIKKIVKNQLKVFKYEGEIYFKDYYNNIYLRDKDEGGVLLPKVDKDYLKIGKYNGVTKKIEFNGVNLIQGKKETKINNKFALEFKKMGIDLMDKKMLYIGSNIKMLLCLMVGGVNIKVYPDLEENKEEFMNKLKNEIGLEDVKTVKGNYFITYIQDYEKWKDIEEEISTLILTPKISVIQPEKIIYKIKEFGKNHYLINKRNYKNEFYQNLVKYSNYMKMIQDLPDYVNNYDNFYKYLKDKIDNNKDDEIPDSIREFKKDYIFKNLKKFLKDDMIEIYNNLSHAKKIIMVENNLFTLARFENDSSIGKKEVTALKSKKKLKKERKKFDNILLEARIKDMLREKENMDINLTLNKKGILKHNLPKDKDKKESKKKKQKIGEECKTDDECYSKKCDEETKTCVSKTSKKKTESKKKTKKESTKKKTKKESTKKKTSKKKAKIGEFCETDQDCARNKPCQDNKCISTTKKKSTTTKKKKKSPKKKSPPKTSPKLMTLKKVKKLIKKILKNYDLTKLTMGDMKNEIKRRDKEFYKKNKEEIIKIIKEEVNKEINKN